MVEEGELIPAIDPEEEAAKTLVIIVSPPIYFLHHMHFQLTIPGSNLYVSFDPHKMALLSAHNSSG